MPTLSAVRLAGLAALAAVSACATPGAGPAPAAPRSAAGPDAQAGPSPRVTTRSPQSTELRSETGRLPAELIHHDPRLDRSDPQLVHPDPPPHVTELYPYELDDVSRRARRGRYLICPELPLVWYRGSVVRYQRAARVYRGFLKKLHRMEQIVAETAIEFYGRPPRRIVQSGSYYCRQIRSCKDKLSEHALGNAIDIEGFDFGRISARQAPELPRALRRPLKVRLGRHWDGGDGVVAETHQAFLRTLALRMIEEESLFRVVLGPADRGHQNHFHFDAAPRRIVDVFAEGDPEAERTRVIVEDPGCND